MTRSRLLQDNQIKYVTQSVQIQPVKDEKHQSLIDVTIKDAKIIFLQNVLYTM